MLVAYIKEGINPNLGKKVIIHVSRSRYLFYNLCSNKLHGYYLRITIYNHMTINNKRGWGKGIQFKEDRVMIH